MSMSTVQPQNYESINVDLHLTQDLVDTEFMEESNSDMLEEEIEFQDIDRCKIVELPDKQDIERYTSPEMAVRIVYEQEECIGEEICDVSLPKLYRAEEEYQTYDNKFRNTQNECSGNK